MKSENSIKAKLLFSSWRVQKSYMIAQVTLPPTVIWNKRFVIYGYNIQQGIDI